MPENGSDNFEEYNELVAEAKQKILEKLHRVQIKHDKVNEALRGVKGFSERVLTTGANKMSQGSKSKLIALYNTALKQCEGEADSIRKVLDEIQKLRKTEFDMILDGKMSRGQMISLLNDQSRTLPLFVGGVTGHPPPGVGAIAWSDSDELPNGSIVAAFVDDVWILAKIMSTSGNGKYDIRDIDDEGSRRIAIRRQRLIPLPIYRADPHRDAHALFPINAIVLALYPQTTCFYKGVVERTPQNEFDDYLIAFEDNSFDSGYSPPFEVAQRYVITFKYIKPKGKPEE
ncbi:unnamed protein product [Bursaphelenchus xylophilus]|uniref:(pine wood nematode) hypothetical protein n=1 Tax=Bursaphelenchus xylophilus TaxID=6326 RepID=A0A1I7RHR3_BURXY|nr:unnamed protein product [Bursaphelenchus xylophilus]CAG9115470.1 unnamed protein product [Bursaphelenchus xylophilus]